MGVAGPKPSKAGVGSASPRPRAKPGSVQGREPTRVGSCPESACAAEGAPGCKGVARPKPSIAGGGCSLSPREALVGQGAHPGGSCPDSAFTAEGAQYCMGVARPKSSDAGESAASPSWAKPGSRREPTRVGSCPSSAFAAEGAPGCMSVVRQKPSFAGEGAASPHPVEALFRLCLGQARSPLEWGPAKIQPARQEARQAARALTVRSQATQGRVQPLPSPRQSQGRARSPLWWGWAQIQPVLPRARQAAWASQGRG